MVERSLSMREVPGSIPGASIPHFKLILDSYILSIKVGSIFTHKLFVDTEKNVKHGDAGYRSPYLSHAKRALYHLSYIPRCMIYVKGVE